MLITSVPMHENIFVFRPLYSRYLSLLQDPQYFLLHYWRKLYSSLLSSQFANSSWSADFTHKLVSTREDSWYYEALFFRPERECPQAILKLNFLICRISVILGLLLVSNLSPIPPNPISIRVLIFPIWLKVEENKLVNPEKVLVLIEMHCE